ncbi:MAG: hypothetical protein K1X79_03485 [Oligoflexia bacterium]|nr:hypothetical protein [Oligoflexia bacterium]
MDETSKAIIDKVTQRYAKPTQVAEGVCCTVYYDCARLTPSDLARLSAEATGDLDDQDFDMVVGLAYTGIFFAAAVAGGRLVGIFQTDGKLFGPAVKAHKVLLVDDVIYSGTRMKRAQQAVEAAGGRVVGFACIVDRSAKPGKLDGKTIWSAHQSELQ